MSACTSHEGEHAFLLKRLRLADQEPVAVETAYLPCRICPGLLQEDLAGNSLYTLLAEKYNRVPTWADAEIEAVMPDKGTGPPAQLESRDAGSGGPPGHLCGGL